MFCHGMRSEYNIFKIWNEQQQVCWIAAVHTCIPASAKLCIVAKANMETNASHIQSSLPYAQFVYYSVVGRVYFSLVRTDHFHHVAGGAQLQPQLPVSLAGGLRKSSSLLGAWDLFWGILLFLFLCLLFSLVFAPRLMQHNIHKTIWIIK